MPLSYQNYTGNNSTDTFAIPFTYTATSEISVTVDGVAQTGLTFPSATSVQLTSPPATGTLVQVRRATDLSARAVDYVSGSVLTEEDLDNANIQVFHAAQEAIDTSNDGITLGSDDKWDAQSKVIKNVADPVANTDAVNKQFISTNLPNINTVAGIQGDVTTVAGKATEIDVIVNKFDGSTTATSGTNLNLTQIDTVADNIADVSTVATNITDVVAVANDLNETVSEIETAALDLQATSSKIDTVATNIANVNTVGTDIANVNTVAGDITNVNQLAGALSLQTTFVVTVAGGVFVIDGTSNPTLTLDRGATYIFDVSDSSVAGHPLAFKDGSGNAYTTGVTSSGTAGSANATVTIVVAANAPSSLRYYCTVHGNSMGNTISVVNNNLTTVAANITNVNNVGGDITNVNAVATNIAGTNTIGTVATDIANVNAVGGDIANVNAVAGNATNINAVAGNATNINAVNSNATNINAVAADATDIGTVATNISNVNAVGTDIANVNTVASNLTNVNSFADTYFISATAPLNPTQGDLWFDTDPAVLTMKVYDGSGFVNAGSSVNGTSNRTTYTATAGQQVFNATYDAGFVDVYLNGVKLINGTDFTATNGSSISLTTGAAANDTVDIVGYGTFELQNTALDDLSDVNVASASSGQFLKYDGTNFVPDNIPASNDASALTTGTLAAARLPTTGVDASSLSTGTLAAGRLPATGVNAASLSTGTLAKSVLPSGSILQCQFVNISNATTNTTANSYADINDASITLTSTVANSKFLLILEGVIYVQNDANGNPPNGMNLGFRRGSTLIRGVAGSSGDSWAGGFNAMGIYGSYNQARTFLDSPSLSAGTSVTYKGCVGLWSAGQVTFNYAGYSNRSSFHVFEVAP